MTATYLQIPFPVFFDSNGDPLDNGYIYIGRPNENPRTDPIEVFFDAGLTEPAPQPLRTIRGRIDKRGSPANVYADLALPSQYSMTVLNKNQELVFSVPQGTGFDSALGNLEINENTITTLNQDGNIILDPNGTGHVILDSNVGIGVNPPLSLLHVSGADPVLTITNSNGDDLFSTISSISGDLEFNSRSAGNHGQIIFKRDNGTTNLETARFAADGKFVLGLPGGNDNAIFTGSSSTGTTDHAGTNLLLKGGDGSGAGSSHVSIWTSEAGASGTQINTATEKLRITSDGKCVLGPPGGNDNAIITGTSSTGIADHNGTNLLLKGGDGSGTGGSHVSIWTSTNGAAGTQINAATEKLRITSDGRVGLGNDASGFNPSADDLVIGDGSGDSGLTLYTGASNAGTLAFTQNTGSLPRGQIQYNLQSDWISFGLSEFGQLNAIREAFFFTSNGEFICRGTANTMAAFSRYGNDDHAPEMSFSKSRGGFLGNVIVQNGDHLGQFTFDGSDGLNSPTAAQIIVAVDGVPSTSSMPGRIEFRTTPAGTHTLQTRMTIANDGAVTVNGALNAGSITTTGALSAGSASITGALSANTLSVDNISLNSNIISATGTNTSLRLQPAGTGLVIVNNNAGATSLELVPATQVEAEAGTNNTRIMTPLRVKNALDEAAPSANGRSDGLSITVSNTGGVATIASLNLGITPKTLTTRFVVMLTLNWAPTAAGTGNSFRLAIGMNNSPISRTYAYDNNNDGENVITTIHAVKVPATTDPVTFNVMASRANGSSNFIGLSNIDFSVWETSSK